jgi:pheromone shutdown protein TraB
VIPWVVVALILTGFGIGFSRNPDLGWQLVLDWVLINGGLAAAGALIAAAHPVTVLSAALAAPLTSLNPTIGVGFVAAGVETFLRKPNVGDFARLKQDTSHPGGWWRNRVSRVLLVFLLTTVGSAVGTYVAGFRIFERLVG